MIDDVFSDHSDQGLLLPLCVSVYLQETACPGSVLFMLRPDAALRKVCRDCALNPTRAACMRQHRVRRARRAPRRQRGCHRASGTRDDGGGDGGDGGPPPLNQAATSNPSKASAWRRSMIAPEELLRAQRLTGRVNPLDAFIARCEARALLWQCGEHDLHNAVDVLQADADASGLVLAIGDDGVQQILAHAFAAVRDDLNGWRPLSFKRQS